VQWLPPAFKPEVVFTQTVLVIVAFVAGLPLMVKPAQAAFAGISPRMREAASTLDEYPWRVFWRVDVPLAWRGVDAIVTNSLHYAPPADVGVQVEPA